MSKSPEEYFLDEELSPEERGEEVAFSDTERAFLEKYLGLERDILDRLGIEEAAEPQAVELPEVEPTPPAPLPEEEPAPVEEESAAESVGVEETEAAEPAPEVEQIREEMAEPAIEQEAEAIPDAEAIARADMETEPSLDDEIRAQNEVQLVSFYLADQEFTIPINAVQEVVRYMEPTAVPESHGFLAGIVNMRGRVTPVLRLGVILGKEEPPAEEDAPDEDKDARRFFIVCRKGDVQVALLVERVHTMYRVPQSAIEWNIEQRMGADVDIVRGLLRSGDDLVGIVSLERMLDKVGMQGGLGG